MTTTYRVIFWGTVLAAIVGVVLYRSSQSTVFFLTPNEIGQAPESYVTRTIRLGGLVVPGSARWDAATGTLWFAMTEDYSLFMRVRYHGPVPELFREGRGAVVEGMIDDRGLLWATLLLVKHDPSYSVKHSEMLDKKMIYKSVIRD